MKIIGIDAHVLTGKFQGSRTVLLELLLHIGQLDKDNQYIIYSFDPKTVSGQLAYQNFVHRAIPFHSAILRLLCFWPYARIRDSLDILITQYNCPPLYPWKQAVFIHDILFETHPRFFPPLMRWRLQILTRLSAFLAEAVFVVSDYTREAVKNGYRLSDTKVHLVRNGFNKALLAERGSALFPGLKSYILCVGRLEPRKNIETLLKAFRRTAREDLQLVIVGRADFSSDALLEEMKNEKNVVHINEATGPELTTLYRHARLFVYPSFAEGFGLPLLEALSYGVPVISSDQTALPEVGGPFVTYFDPLSPDAVNDLAREITRSLASPPQHDAEELRRHLESFDWRRSAMKLLAVINKL